MGLAWGATMTLSGLVQNLSGALAVRFFLGGKAWPRDDEKCLQKLLRLVSFQQLSRCAVTGKWE